MKYQKITNLLDNTPNQPSKFRTKNWVGITDDARGTYNTKNSNYKYNYNSQIRFRISMLKSSLCDYSDAYILVRETITAAELAAGRKNNGIEVVFKNCAILTDCTSEINNIQIDNAKDIDVAMYNLIEYSDNYSKTSGSLWQHYRDEPALTNAGALDNFPANSASFKFKQKIIGSTGNNGTKKVKIMVPLKI